MRKYFPLISIFLLTIFVSCNNKNPSYVVVSGNAQIEIPIDFMYIDISVFGYSSSPNSARDQNIPKIKNLIEALHEMGIADSAITTTNYSFSKNDRYKWDEELSKDRLFYFSYNLVAILSDISRYDLLQERLAKIGATDISIKGYGSHSIQKYNDLLYKNALEDAKSRASFLINSNNQKLGDIYKLLGFGYDINNTYEDINETIDYFINNDANVSLTDWSLSEDESMSTLLKRKSFSKEVKITVAYYIL